MNSRERLLAALNHKEADRVPFDIGGSGITGISATAYKNLVNYLNMPEKDEDIKIYDMVQQLATPSENFLQKMGVDVRSVTSNPPSNWEMKIEEDGSYKYFRDQFGIKWRMPAEGGFYYDMAQHPLEDAMDVEDIDNYKFPDPDDAARYVGLREKAQKVRDAGHGVVLASISAGIFELGGWLRGLANFYADLAGEPEMACKVMDKALDMKMRYWEKVFGICGDLIDVVQEADDIGGQNSMLISPEMYRKYIKPRHKEFFDFIHSKTKGKIFIHSCGSFREVLPDLIEIGLDIINPVQFNCRGMDAEGLKRDFGKDLVFWGGGVDTQYILPKGTPQEVKDCVRKQIETLAPGGGYVFNTVHNIQADVPPENLAAMKEAFDEYSKY
jgi:uroporphyrinogen decarboxylase